MQVLCEGYLEETKKYLAEELNERRMELPADITPDAFTEAFLDYLETGYWDWVNDNARSFFRDVVGNDWEEVRRRMGML